MASVPKAATSGGSGRRQGSARSTSPTGSKAPKVSSDRGQHRVGPTHCAARRGRHTTSSSY